MTRTKFVLIFVFAGLPERPNARTPNARRILPNFVFIYRVSRIQSQKQRKESEKEN